MKRNNTFGTAAERLTQLQRALLPDVNEMTCEQCLAQLDEYITAQLAGVPYLTQFPATAVHLDTCPECADAYARLYDLALADAVDALPHFSHRPAPDLSFLPSQPTLLEQLRDALQRSGDRLALQLTAGLVSLLQPPPNAAPAVRSGAARYGDRLMALDEAQAEQLDSPVTFTAYRDAQQPEMCLLEVVVQPPEVSWPALGGNTVIIELPEAQRQAVTDAWGVAAFPDVPVRHLPSLRLVVILADE